MSGWCTGGGRGRCPPCTSPTCQGMSRPTTSTGGPVIPWALWAELFAFFWHCFPERAQIHFRPGFCWRETGGRGVDGKGPPPGWAPAIDFIAVGGGGASGREGTAGAVAGRGVVCGAPTARLDGAQSPNQVPQAGWRAFLMELGSLFKVGDHGTKWKGEVECHSHFFFLRNQTPECAPYFSDFSKASC